LRQEIAAADVILYGTLHSPRFNPTGKEKNGIPAGDERDGVTDLQVEGVLKSHPALPQGKVTSLGRYIPVQDPKKPPRYLLFCEFCQGRLVPYRGILLTSDALVKYLQGSLQLDPKKPGDALRFYHRHLESPDAEVAQDAYTELDRIPYEHVRKHAPLLSPDVIAARLQKKAFPVWMVGTEGMLLGHCGTERHAALLKGMIDKRRKEREEVNQGILVGYTLLCTKEGLAAIRAILTDTESSFPSRYRALKALDFFQDNRRDILSGPQVIESLYLTLDQPDMADLTIERLRTLRVEKTLERVLALHGKKEFDFLGMRRAILKFALTFPNNPKAARFIEQRRAENPEFVNDLEELLEVENNAAAKP
jgi:hypothetical protein